MKLFHRSPVNHQCGEFLPFPTLIQSLLRILGRGGVPGRPGELLPVDGEDVVVAGRQVPVNINIKY